MMIKNERKVGAILTYVNIFLNTAVMLFYTPFLIRQLGQSEFGLYSLALSIINYLIIFDLGLGNAIVVFTSKYLAKNEVENQKALYGTVFSVYLFMSFIAVLVGIYFYNSAENLFSNTMSAEEIGILKKMFIILTVNIAFTLPMNTFLSILTAYEKFVFIKSLRVLRAVLVPCFSTIVLLLGYKSIAVILCITFLNIIYLIVQYIYYKRNINIEINIKKFDKQTLKIVGSYSFFIFLAMIVDQINWNSGQFIIGAYLGAKEVAVFAIVITICTTFMTLSTAISSVLLPKVSKMISAGATGEELTSEMIKVGRMQSYIIYMIFFCFVLFGQDFIRFWVGAEYLDAYIMTIMIMFPLSVPLVQNLGLSILQAKNKYKFKAVTTLIGAVLSILLTINLIHNYNYFIVSFSMCLSFFIFYIFIINIYYSNIIKLNMYRFWQNIFVVFFKQFLVFIIIYIIKGYFDLFEDKYFVLGISVFFMFYIVVLYNFIINDYERYVIGSVLYKLKMIKK